MTRFGGMRRMGALYRDGVALRRPTRPWLIDLTALCPFPGLELGDIADFTTAPNLSRWHIGDTPDDPAAALQWVVIEEDARTLLICDRVILVRVSWDDLNIAGYVAGRPVTIDGKQTSCRLLTGGTAFRVLDDGWAGGAPGNEWDRYVAGGADVEGLPRPAADDAGQTPFSRVPQEPHNTIWNWFGAHSWTSQPFDGRHTARCCRGYQSARYFYLNTQSHRHEDIGWRPVLEVKPPPHRQAM